MYCKMCNIPDSIAQVDIDVLLIFHIHCWLFVFSIIAFHDKMRSKEGYFLKFVFCISFQVKGFSKGEKLRNEVDPEERSWFEKVR